MFLSQWLEKQFGSKVYKLSLSSGCTCPNRDGKISYGGCSFCSEGGSGEFAEKNKDITVQIEEAKKRVQGKFPKNSVPKYIAYFQSFSNTYVDEKINFEYLCDLYTKTINMDEIVALSIGTRPDCLSSDMLDFLEKLNRVKPVWVELGLQTIHEKTSIAINRGYSLDVFKNTYHELKKRGITVIVHIIVGLPGESVEMNEETVKYLAALNPVPDGIKIQNLQILEGTALGSQYKNKPFYVYNMEEYGEILLRLISLLPEKTVIHRITGDGPKKILIEPKWSANKRVVMNYLNKILKKM